jgi:PIN domain nuclease of toxin-antitoxin system
MQILLDTHSFLWWISDDPQLSKTARKTIEDGANEVFFSAASAWELAIKNQLGKLRLPNTPEAFVSEQLQLNGFRPLSITVSHSLHTASLPAIHRDPFDRILVAQSQLEQFAIVTTDRFIRQYEVSTIW